MTKAGSGALLLILVVFVAIVASYSAFIPYWDARSYFNCVAQATQKPFSLLNFRCVGHPSIVYLLLLGATQYVAPWNVSLMYAVNAVLGALSIGAFRGILGLLFPGRPATEYALATALYALAPLLVVHAIFLNVDYGLTVFFVLFVYFLLARHFWTASAFAIAMMFSKETGAAVYAVTVASYIVAFTPVRDGSWKERLGNLRSQVPLAAAPVAVAIYIVAFRLIRPDSSTWIASYLPVGAVHDPVDMILSVNPADASMRSYLADIFVLNFQWLYSGVLVAAACAALVRTADGEDRPVAVPGTGVFLFLLLAGLGYIVTRYRAYNNARYVLVACPVLIIVFYGGLLSLFRRGAARRLFLTPAVVLVLLSNFRTIDFVSKRVFGTFRFGSHAVLDMPSLIGGLKLDSTVYNLESLQYHYLLSDVMHDLQPPAHATFFMGDTTYNFPPLVDGRTYDLTMDPSHALPLTILSGDDDVTWQAMWKAGRRPGDRFFYMAFANADNHQLNKLLRLYPVIDRKEYSRRGYSLDVYTFAYTPQP